MTAHADFFEQSAKLYRQTLVQNVVPFWVRHGLGSSDGALNNCLDDSGRVVSMDRYLWSQGRALWTFSALYNRIEQRPLFLQTADRIFSYLSRHGRDAQGRWMFLLDAQGKVKEADTSVYVDGFVLNGLGEYFAATGNEEARRVALQTFENTRSRLLVPGSYATAPYLLPPGMKSMGVAMIFSFFFYHAGKIFSRPDITDAGYWLARELLGDFYSPKHDAVLELVNLDGRAANSPEGRACVPGHVIEAMWFLMSIFEEKGDTARLKECPRLIRRHIELAWDEKEGGLTLALDVEGKRPVFWKKPDYKPWWVQVEALVATAYAYLLTGESWCIEWHRKIQSYAFSRYPTPAGEWIQWLDHEGRPAESAALPVKDPFHLPRGLIYLIDLFERRIPPRPATVTKGP